MMEKIKWIWSECPNL